MSEKYIPQPIDTTAIELSDDIKQLGEVLARNNHDNYCKQRMADGWTLGPRNDEKKTNPTLIPYEELSESERVYDRITCTETLKCIIALGYKIVKE